MNQFCSRYSSVQLILTAASVVQAIDLHKRGKETKQAMYRRLIHTALDVDNIQEVSDEAVLSFSLGLVLLITHVDGANWECNGFENCNKEREKKAQNVMWKKCNHVCSYWHPAVKLCFSQILAGLL